MLLGAGTGLRKQQKAAVPPGATGHLGNLDRVRLPHHAAVLPAPAPLPPPPAGLQDEMFKLLSKNFDEAYNGNRAPFQLSVHSPWFTFVSALGVGPAAHSCWRLAGSKQHTGQQRQACAVPAALLSPSLSASPHPHSRPRLS